ncbi:endocuticle structural glycoprotein ABD-4-like [Onthophagus taurus]|uniref:endocuticle structural glycoprotein ABD-4-like n=1 Tax=Onthophagus taurus TaxID=166361 RepID=UPI000C20B7BC|nr:endocuticle structural glycoprotein ABD-4-like [Onthophagus taurus]
MVDRTLVCCLVLCLGIINVTGAPQGAGDKDAQIVSQTNDVNPDGGYKWSYETSNSIKAEETGTVKKTNNAENPEVIVAQGSYSYTDPEGNHIEVVYTADDEGGFQPQGAHFPTPPPIPPLIQKGLDYIAAHPSKDSQP